MQRLAARAPRDHEVTVKDNASEALALLLAGESFDVIFCDLDMPQIGGMELHAACRQR